jgi:hypothetical protein
VNHCSAITGLKQKVADIKAEREKIEKRADQIIDIPYTGTAEIRIEGEEHMKADGFSHLTGGELEIKGPESGK